MPVSISGIVERVAQRRASDAGDALTLYRDAPTPLLGRLADDVRRRKHPDGVVTYIIDRNVNYTNVCVARCKFCAFYRPGRIGGGLHARLRRDLQEDRRDDPARRRAAAAAGRPQSGRAAGVVRGSVPRREAALSRRSSCTRCRRRKSFTSRGCRSCRCRTVIDRLIAAGLDSIPGGGAEILVDRVRRILNCYNKATADEWLDVMRDAHRAGLRTTATMMYGTVETIGGAARAPVPAARSAGRDRRLHRVHHLELPAAAHRARRHRGDRRRLPAHARDRAARARQLRQPAGVVGHAGRQGRAAQPGLRRQRHGQRDDRGERRPRRRRRVLHGRVRGRPQHRERRASWPSAATCTTTMLGDPIFRERDVPRMLELAVARADGRGRRGRRSARATRRAAPPAAKAPGDAAEVTSRSCAPAGCCRSIGRPSTAAGSTVARRPHHAASAHGPPPAAGRGSRRRRAAAGPGQRPHASRAELDGRPGAARRVDGRVDSGALLRLAARGRAGRRGRRVAAAARAAARRCATTGTVLVGDISNTLHHAARAARGRARRRRVHELLGFNAVDPARRWFATRGERVDALEPMPPAEPRSSSRRRARAVLGVAGAVRGDRRAAPAPRRSSMHLGESPEEIEFLRTGRGPIRDDARGARRLDRTRGARPTCDPGEVRRPTSATSQPGMLVVHGVHLTDDGLERLRRAGAVLVTCPRSNRWVGAGLPRLSHFYAARLPVAIGTDSLASVADAEPVRRAGGDAADRARRRGGDAARQRDARRAPRRSASARDFGTIAPGKRRGARRRRRAGRRARCGRIPGQRRAGRRDPSRRVT